MNKKKKHILNRNIILFTQQVSEILEIPVPKITIEESAFKDKSQLAATVVGGIVLSSNIFTSDVAFAIACELRYQWQLLYHEDEFFPNSYIQSKSDGTLQRSMIDTKAFSSLIMTAIYNTTPLLSSFSEQEKSEIKKRTDEIKNDVYQNIQHHNFHLMS